jgi:hypothetical protein
VAEGEEMTPFTPTEKAVLLSIYITQLGITLTVLWVCIKILIEDRRKK